MHRAAHQSVATGDVGDYRRYLEAYPQEWQALDAFCRITISRVYRDRRVFDALARDGMEELLSLCRVLCRNLAFTYFVPTEQKAALQRIEDRLIPGGLLVLGSHERLPHVSTRWELLWRPGLPIYRKVE